MSSDTNDQAPASPEDTPASFRSGRLAGADADLLTVDAVWPPQLDRDGKRLFATVGGLFWLIAAGFGVVGGAGAVMSGMISLDFGFTTAGAVGLAVAIAGVAAFPVLMGAVVSLLAALVWAAGLKTSGKIRLAPTELSWPGGSVKWNDLREISWDDKDLVLVDRAGAEYRWKRVSVAADADREWLVQLLRERADDWMGDDALAREQAIRDEADELADRRRRAAAVARSGPS